MKILFICRGNVGRSQIAEAFFNEFAAGKHIASSCGTITYTKEGESRHGQKLKDLKAAGEVVNSLKELGLDISENKIEQITEEVVRDAAKVVVMAEKDTLPDYITNNSKFIYWDIKDLKGLNQKDTNKIRDEISEKVKGLINELT